MTSIRLLATVLLASALAAGAEEPKKPVNAKKSKAPKLDLALPSFEALPTNSELEAPRPPGDAETAVRPETAAEYALVSITHAKPGAARSEPSLAQISASGSPLVTEPFTSVVRVRSERRRSAVIEISVFDARERPAMEARGHLLFKHADETEWIVDWAPTTVRTTGDFTLQVRVGGALVGTATVKVVETPR